MPANRLPVLIVATAARALAQSARKGGMRAITLDRFADRDTREAAIAAHAIVAGVAGFDSAALLRTADKCCPPRHGHGLMYGSGFEGRPDVLAALAVGRRLYGNSPDTVERLKDPRRFFALLDRLGIPHPETRVTPPEDMQGWLVKQKGASGGAHVQAAARVRENSSGRRFYYQRRWPGRGVSVLFLADGRRCRVFGVSETWTTLWDARAPYRFAGAVSDANLESDIIVKLSEAAQALTAEAGLVGFNGLDALVRDQEFAVLEVNPRPGATFELYDAKFAESFFALHLRACNGELPSVSRGSSAAHAHAVVYSPKSVVIAESQRWPPWCSDLSIPGTAIAAGAPLCMVHASGATAAPARRQVLERELQVSQGFAHEPTVAQVPVAAPARA
jgi:predicted ATP-grasp superfamily ATP-dependent carboligase